MNRENRIVYLGTEGNLKSILGLDEIVRDGWNVRLVIAYDGPPVVAPGGVRGVSNKILSHARQRFPTIYTFLRSIYRRKISSKTLSNIPPNMKAICDANQIQYISTADKFLQSLKDDIRAVSPDVILSNGWQFKITKDIFSIACLMALNCHSSYLPEYRGGNVTFAPLINEEKQSGVTVHELTDKFDAGVILAQERVSIEPGETPESLNMKRALITGKVLITALENAGHPERYKPNPPSPFYFRCDFATYRRMKMINSLRKLVGLPIIRYEPNKRYDV